MTEAGTLRERAASYRGLAEQTENSTIWHIARLRDESRRARHAAAKLAASAAKREMASLALDLAMAAEALDRNPAPATDPDDAAPHPGSEPMQHLLSPTRALKEICRDVGHDLCGKRCLECALGGLCAADSANPPALERMPAVRTADLLVVQIVKPANVPLGAWLAELRIWMDENDCQPVLFANAGRIIDRLLYNVTFADRARSRSFACTFAHYTPSVRRPLRSERAEIRHAMQAGSFAGGIDRGYN